MILKPQQFYILLEHNLKIVFLTSSEYFFCFMSYLYIFETNFVLF